MVLHNKQACASTCLQPRNCYRVFLLKKIYLVAITLLLGSLVCSHATEGGSNICVGVCLNTET